MIDPVKYEYCITTMYVGGVLDDATPDEPDEGDGWEAVSLSTEHDGGVYHHILWRREVTDE